MVYIQDAHASLEAQDSIKNILHHLHQEYGLDLIFLEGAVGRLDADLIRFFKKESLNKKAAELFARESIIGATELFLLDATVTPIGNPAMPMKMPFGPKGFQNIDWNIPNLLMSNIPGFDNVATSLMKQTFKKKGVATIEELREMCIEMDNVRLIGCQMTMDVFGFKREDFIDKCEIGGAATFLEYAADADVNLFI